MVFYVFFGRMYLFSLFVAVIVDVIELMRIAIRFYQ